MTCDNTERLFSACWDDELSLAEREQLEAHFASCRSCRESYDEFARTLELVQRLPRLEPRPDLLGSVLARVRPGAVEAPEAWWRRAWSRPLDGRLPAWQPALAAAAVVVVAAGAWWVAQQFGSAPGRPVASPPTSFETAAPTPLAGGGVARGGPADLASPGRDAVPDESPTVAHLDERVAATVFGQREPERRTRLRREAPPEAFASGSGAGRALAATAAEEYPVVPDSLFDHRLDMEFALEPVNLRRVPGDTGLAPARPMPSSEVGRPASITF